MSHPISEDTAPVVYTCDVCSCEIVYPASCSICDINLCWMCPEWSSDGSKAYCPQCWDIGEPYRKTLDNEKVRHSTNVGRIEHEWKRQALAALAKREAADDE